MQEAMLGIRERFGKNAILRGMNLEEGRDREGQKQPDRRSQSVSEERKTSGKYNSIMGLPHHVSAKHRHMSMTERAAQFSPFAALNGYEDAVSETARLTDGRPDLDEYERDAIDRKLREIMESDEDLPVTLTYFRPDAKKSAGGCI